MDKDISTITKEETIDDGCGAGKHLFGPKVKYEKDGDTSFMQVTCQICQFKYTYGIEGLDLEPKEPFPDKEKGETPHNMHSESDDFWESTK